MTVFDEFDWHTYVGPNDMIGESHTCHLVRPVATIPSFSVVTKCPECNRLYAFDHQSSEPRWFYSDLGMPIRYPTRAVTSEPILTMTIFDMIGNFSDVIL